jgi:hypothetical protein
MAGVTPILPPRTGCINGKLEVETDRFIILDELLTSLPAMKTFFSELTRMGWSYFFIEGYGTVVLEIEIAETDYKWLAQEHPRGGFAYNLALEFGRRLPKIGFKNISRLNRFIINICSKDHARGVTADLKSKKVTFIHDSLWGLKSGKITREAKDILEIVRWLIEEKKFKLEVSGGMEHFHKLAASINSGQKPRRTKAQNES